MQIVPFLASLFKYPISLSQCCRSSKPLFTISTTSLSTQDSSSMSTSTSSLPLSALSVNNLLSTLVSQILAQPVSQSSCWSLAQHTIPGAGPTIYSAVTTITFGGEHFKQYLVVKVVQDRFWGRWQATTSA